MNHVISATNGDDDAIITTNSNSTNNASVFLTITKKDRLSRKNIFTLFLCKHRELKRNLKNFTSSQIHIFQKKSMKQKLNHEKQGTI